jgi:hypothetical protein
MTIQLENVNSTSEPFHVPIGKFTVTIAGQFNGGSVELQRRLPDQRTWTPVKSFAEDGKADLVTVPISAGLHRLVFSYAPDTKPALDDAVQMAGRARDYGVVANDPEARKLADDLVAHVDAAVSAVKDGRVTDATGSMTLAEFFGLSLRVVPCVASDPVIAVAHAQRAVAAIVEMQALKAPAGISFSIT